MKNVAPILAALLLVSCGGDERPLTASCEPQVNVTVQAESPAPTKAKSVAKPASSKSEVVQVFWDVSSSMREFTKTRRATKTNEAWVDDLKPVVDTLDSSVLLRAHATAVEQYSVGKTIKRIDNTKTALELKAENTALHLVAEQIGTALANGSTQAALIVSDLELDTPKRTSPSETTVCGGVPLPSTPQAGSLFGRCFENAVLAVPAARTRTNLLVHVFEKRTHDRELFILLFATDREFGKRISEEVLRRLSFQRQVIFDSGAVTSANVKSCTLTAPADDVQPRTLSGCGAKCFESEATIQAQCDVRRVGEGAWIFPAGQGIEGASYEPSAKAKGEADERALVRFVIPCSTPPGRFDASVAFSWQKQTPWSRDQNVPLAAKPSVRDLFDSLGDAIIRAVPSRKMRIGIELMP